MPAAHPSSALAPMAARSAQGIPGPMLKAHIHAHSRHLASGKVISVRAHEDRREFHAGPLAIGRGKNLTREQRAVEQRAAHALQADVEGHIQRYYALHGKGIIDADKVKDLFPEYAADPRKHAASIHEPSSALAKILFHRRLDTLPRGSVVVFTAGGGGSGKSLATAKYKPDDEQGFVYDATMSRIESAETLIQAALAKHMHLTPTFSIRSMPVWSC